MKIKTSTGYKVISDKEFKALPKAEQKRITCPPTGRKNIFVKNLVLRDWT